MAIKKKKKHKNINRKNVFLWYFVSFFNYKFYSYIKTKNYRTTAQRMRVLNSPAHAFFLPALSIHLTNEVFLIKNRSVFLPRESHGQRSLVGCCPWDSTESDMTEAI